ncbi:MAG: phenylacetic acid degradation protein [Burkholderiales bacterium RIFCSPLOWO2_02_FULL_57_36]|nr:MAG: phenylacetic acid degradation protein [Burkholderiales bacterium RIFCSPLOWO2_02_FULL_57_36]
MDRNAFFWKIQDGRLPQPQAARTLGANIISVDFDTGAIEIEFEGKEEFINPAGKIQGGFLSAMLDDTMGPALAATLKADEFAPTLDLHVQFLSPAVPGKLHGVGRVVRRGGAVCFLAGELSQGGKVVATAIATALIRKL